MSKIDIYYHFLAETREFFAARIGTSAAILANPARSPVSAACFLGFTTRACA